ncbi:selenide, water dikinase [Kordiimonas sediminis]|uniref:Selenide, water dikinase n=1 Tax=Kordiimonas sediminis TaxID=1735581 RepID=A0A919AJW3_9PROT|nr:selenide, water dikinase SelD [Kordiimonas sediminis]GHF11489.1 selenide, water dikinase [Kordiimonas sediminis]
MDIKLTEYSHGAGCGCKISPKILDTILRSSFVPADDPKLLVGNATRDDAAVYDMGDGRAVISTTDFFMPIVDDPFDFGRIAATNAISDIYAMGGKPLMAIAILGWPVNVLAPEVAAKVIDGGRQACAEAGILLAGGHSIDAPEPIFGLAVTGEVQIADLKENSKATAGSKLFLTKPLGVGVLTTATKQKKLKSEHANLARDIMCQMNSVGADFAKLPSVTALTDITGFGLLGHLAEICEGSGLGAVLDFASVPVLPPVEEYLDLGCIPGGTNRNFDSYGHKIGPVTDRQKQILCDPQTSGGLLVAVEPFGLEAFYASAAHAGLSLEPIGELVPHTSDNALVQVV